MDKLQNILTNYIDNSKNNVFFKESFKIKNVSFKKIGEILLDVSTILEELTSENIYIVCVKSLFNPAFIAIEIKSEQLYIISYAREGFIKQHTAKKAVDKIKKVLLKNDTLIHNI